jgi:hypothetical protein
MQSQRWHKKKEYQHDAQLDKKQQNQSAEFFVVDFEEARRHGCAGVPKQERRTKIEQGEYQADDKCDKKEVPEEKDLLAVHVAIIYLSGARSIPKRFARLILCNVEALKG